MGGGVGLRQQSENKKMAAKEHKEHESGFFHLCGLCVLSWQFSVVAAR
jgi:hypothetical protein